MRALILALLLGGCGGSPVVQWSDQLHPDGPCYRVDLSDGLSETDPNEVLDLYACANAEGAFAPLAGAVATLRDTDRTGQPAALDLAAAWNAIPEAGFTLVDTLDAVIALVEGDGTGLAWVTEAAVELIWGEDWDTLVHREPATGSLQAGVVAPFLEVIPPVATTLLDDDRNPLGFVTDVLRADGTTTVVHTLSAAARTEEAPLSTAAQDLPAALGDALLASADASNDRSTQASGNSLRDLAEPLLADDARDGRPVVEHLLDAAWPVLADDVVLAGLEDVLRTAYLEGSLDLLPAQVLHLASEDVAGHALDRGEDSALVALVRLLDTGNQEVSCSVLIWDVDVVDNFSVWLLELMATQDPERMRDGVRIAGFTLEWSDFIETVGETCGLDGAALAADAPAINRLVDTEVGNLLVVLLELLQALHPADNVDRVPELVDLLSEIHDRDLSHPVEEALRDLATAPVVSLLLDLVPPLLDPWSHETWCLGGAASCDQETWSGWDEDLFPSGQAPVDLPWLLGLVERLRATDETGYTPVQRLQAPVQTALALDATWRAGTSLGTLLTAPGARGRETLLQLPRWVAADPDLAALQTAARVLDTPTLITPVLQVAETPSVCAALGATDTEADGPLPFVSRLVTGGTLEELLRTLRLLLSSLREASP